MDFAFNSEGCVALWPVIIRSLKNMIMLATAVSTIAF